jgi:cytoskeletal protein RodZ
MEQEPQKSSAWLWIVLVILIVLAAGFFAWQNYQKSKTVAAVTSPTTVTTKPTTTATPTTSAVSTADWKTYTYQPTGFSIKYPAEFSYEVVDKTKNPAINNMMDSIVFGEKPSTGDGPWARIYVDINDSTKTVTPPSGIATDVTIAGKAGKKYTGQDTMDYVFTDGKYQYNVGLSDVRTTTQDLATNMINTITLTN